MAITKVTEGVRTLGTGEVATANMATDPTNASNLSSGSVPLAQLGNVDTSGITANKDDIALLGFKVAANGSLAKYNLVDQAIDDFQDASGVDASASTNEQRSTAGNYYSGSVGPDITGGVITEDGAYRVHTFNSSGDYVTDTAQTIDYLSVAGGGGGGGDAAGGVDSAGGGGGGGYRYFTSVSLGAGTFAAVVGAGGAGKVGWGDGNKGGDTSWNSTTTTGGVYGAGANNCGGTGGSGGGGGGRCPSTAAGNQGSYSPVEGYAGGHGTGSGDSGGGGGGSSEVGGNGDGTNGGDGGDGASNSITGSAVYYAGGGGGGSYGSATSGAGGAGGGGTGGDGEPGANGNDNLGGGGGGAGGGNYNGGDGGDGVVIIRRPSGITYSNMTLVSNATTAEAVPTNGDLVMTYTNNVGTATINTDLKAYVSRDNGTTYTQATLADQGDTGGHTILTANGLDISGQPSGTSMRWKIETLNQSATKSTYIQAVSLGWS